MPGGIKQSHFIQVLEVVKVKVYNLDGKVMPPLSRLAQSAPVRSSVVRCFKCRRVIKSGQASVARANGEYSIRLHVACDLVEIAAALRNARPRIA